MEAVLQRNGVVVAIPSEDIDGTIHHLKLPDPDLPDDCVADQIPIQINISPQEIQYLFSISDRCRASTIIGPVQLEKTQNEDFALAGILETANGPISFGVVADGVSRRTFWAARASRIAAFAACETLAELTQSGWRPDRTCDDNADKFVSRLCEIIRVRLREDRERIIVADACPAEWSESLFREYSHRSELWYQTTLIVTILGAEGGWFICCGDGGAARFIVTDGVLVDGKSVLSSSDAVMLPAAVTINATDSLFTRRFVQPAPPGSSLHFVLSSDGFDRSLRYRSRTPGVDAYAALDLSSAESIRTTLEEIAASPDADQDNMSLVHICFPPDAGWPHATGVSHPPPPLPDPPIGSKPQEEPQEEEPLPPDGPDVSRAEADPGTREPDPVPPNEAGASGPEPVVVATRSVEPDKTGASEPGETSSERSQFSRSFGFGLAASLAGSFAAGLLVGTIAGRPVLDSLGSALARALGQPSRPTAVLKEPNAPGMGQADGARPPSSAPPSGTPQRAPAGPPQPSATGAQNLGAEPQLPEKQNSPAGTEPGTRPPPAQGGDAPPPGRPALEADGPSSGMAEPDVAPALPDTAK